MKAKNGVPVAVRLAPDVLEAVDKVAEREGRLRSDILRRIIEQAVKPGKPMVELREFGPGSVFPMFKVEGMNHEQMKQVCLGAQGLVMILQHAIERAEQLAGDETSQEAPA